MRFLVTLLILQIPISLLAHPSSFPTVEQIQTLSPEKQLELVRDLQAVFLEMAEKSSLVADHSEMRGSSRSPASHPSESSLARLQRREKHRLEYLDELGMTEESFEEHERIALKTPLEQRQTAAYKKSHEIWKGLVDRINAAQAKVQSDKYRAEQEVEKRKQDLIDAEKAQAKALEEAEAKKAHDAWVAEMKREKSWAEYFGIDEATKKRKEHIKAYRAQEKIEKRDLAVSEFRKSENNYRNQTNDKKGMVCMFAGWVIESGPCRAPRVLPDNMKFADLDPKSIQCKNGEYICNPLLFGLKLPKTCKSFSGQEAGTNLSCSKLAKPLCASFNGGSPTKECLLTSFQTTPVAVELITKVNPEAFSKYRGQFFEMCNPEMLKNNQTIQKKAKALSISRDVQSTCQVAEKQMAYLQEKYFSRSQAAPVTRDPTGWQR